VIAQFPILIRESQPSSIKGPVPDSETETNLSFELAVLRALVLNTAERVRGAVDDQIRIVRQRMIKYIRRIQADLQTLRFRDAHGLAHRAVEGPLSRPRHGLPAESPSLARLRILKDNLARLGVCHCLQRAILLQVRSHTGALRIRDLRELGTEVA